VNLPKSTSKSSWLTVPAEQWVKVSTWTQARSVRVGKGQEVRDLEAVKCLRVSRSYHPSHIIVRTERRYQHTIYTPPKRFTYRVTQFLPQASPNLTRTL